MPDLSNKKTTKTKKLSDKPFNKKKLSNILFLILFIVLGAGIIASSTYFILRQNPTKADNMANKFMKAFCDLDADALNECSDGVTEDYSEYIDAIKDYVDAKTVEYTLEEIDYDNLKEEVNNSIYDGNAKIKYAKAYNATFRMHYRINTYSDLLTREFLIVSYKKDGNWYICGLNTEDEDSVESTTEESIIEDTEEITETDTEVETDTETDTGSDIEAGVEQE
jgi:hypothetical protein